MRRLLVLGALVAFVGCSGPSGGPPVFRDDREYNAALAEVEALTKGPFQAQYEGFPVSLEEKADVRKALSLIEGLIAFSPTNYGPHALKAMAHRTLDQDDEAVAAYRQALALAPTTGSAEHRIVKGRLHNELAGLLFEQGKYDLADVEVQNGLALTPDDPVLLVTAASIKVEERDLAGAKKLLDRALKADPANSRAKDLKRLLDLASK